jgi:peptidoglycan-N-acetylglucosamine deacetylase
MRHVSRLVAAGLLVSVIGVAGRSAPAEAKTCSWSSPHSVSRVKTTAKLVALTFDDGPLKDVTPTILSTLAQYNVHATFFPVGRLIEKSPEFPRQVVDAGHEIGNHSWSHPAYKPAKVIGELDRATKIIQDTAGVTPTLFRPPYSCLNRALDAAAWKRGMTPIQFSTQSWDSRSPSPRPATTCRNALKGAKPGTIVVFHERKNTAAALPCIIDGFRAMGFEMVTVSELLTHQGQ